MKKFLSVFFVILIVALSVSLGVSAAKRYVFDYTNSMSADEIASIESVCKRMYTEYNLDVMYVIANGTNGKSLDKFTTDLYDEYCDGDDGVVFVYNTNTRTEDEDNWMMIGFGKGRNLAGSSDERADLIDKMKDSLKSGRYYNASTYFTSRCLSFAQGGMKKSVNIGKLLLRIAIAVVIGVIISSIIMGNMKKKLNTAVKQRGAANYIKEGTASITVSRDIFMYSTTTRVRKENESSGGRGVSGTSGGGHSYSGGGGRI